jgi:hypothetical protein
MRQLKHILKKIFETSVVIIVYAFLLLLFSLIACIGLVTFPIWIIPYFIYEHKQLNKEENTYTICAFTDKQCRYTGQVAGNNCLNCPYNPDCEEE